MTTDTNIDTTNTDTTNTDTYGTHRPELATLAKAEATRIHRELSGDPALVLQLDDALMAYQRVAVALLRAVTLYNKTDLAPDTIAAYLQKQLTAEADQAIKRAIDRAATFQNFATNDFRTYVEAAREKAQREQGHTTQRTRTAEHERLLAERREQDRQKYLHQQDLQRDRNEQLIRDRAAERADL